MTVFDEKYTLNAANVSFSMGGVTLLGDMSVQMLAGEVTAVLGPNGAGKSTLLSLLSGQRSSGGVGKVLLNGQAIQSLSPGALARTRAVLPQNTAVAFDFTVQEVVELGRFAHARKPSQNESGIVHSAMQATSVAAFAQRNVNTLSGGEQARTHLARVLAQIWEPSPTLGARWLLLDEPTAALDLSNQHEVLRLARHWANQQGVGVVAVLHDLNLALRYADQVIVLQNGNCVAQGRPDAVLTEQTVRRVWGVKSERVTDLGGVIQLLVG